MYERFHITDIDRLAEFSAVGPADDGWTVECMQLTPGMLEYSLCVAALPGITIAWHEFNQRILFRETMNRWNLVFSAILESDRVALSGGRAFDAGDGMVCPLQDQMEYSLGPGVRTFNVSVSDRLAKSVGWNDIVPAVHRVAGPALSELVTVCRAVTCTLESSAELDLPSTFLYGLRDQILQALAAVIEPWKGKHLRGGGHMVRPTRAYRVVEKVVKHMSERDLGERTVVAEVANDLGLSERTIYDAFRRCLGMGPYEFHIIQKLHLFRAALADGKPYRGKITQAALAAGFEHFGRLAGNYRRHFGETPSETMTRRQEGALRH